LNDLRIVEFQNSAIRKFNNPSITSLLYAAYASGNADKTSSTPDAPSSSYGSWWSNSFAPCNRRTVS